MLPKIRLLLIGIILLLSVIAMAAVVAYSPFLSEEASSAMAAMPAQRQFDFWLGEWDLTWPGEQSGLPAGQIGRGTNSVKAILDSAVIQENFVEHSAKPLRGMSVSVYNQRLGKWQQTWVDNQKSYLDFAGEFQDGKMTLSRQTTTADGKKIIQRMIWYNLAADQFDWNWEASADGGKTWKINWQIHYTRKK